MKKNNAPKIESVRSAAAGETDRKASPKKGGSLGTRALTALICLAVLAYFGVKIYQACADPLITAVLKIRKELLGVSIPNWTSSGEK